MATMASSRLLCFSSICPPSKPIRSSSGSNTAVYFSQFARKTPMNLSSTHSISVFAPLLPNRAWTVSSPSQTPKRLTIVAAKGYKMKTHKSTAKRFRVTGSGKIMRRRAGKQHLLRKKNTKRRKRLSKMTSARRGQLSALLVRGEEKLIAFLVEELDCSLSD